VVVLHQELLHYMGLKMSDLRFIKRVDLSTSASSLSIEDVFTTDFNSYKVMFRDFRTASTTAENLYIQYIYPNGIKNIKGEYNTAVRYIQATSGKQDFRSTNATSSLVGTADQEPESSGITVTVFNPMKTTAFTNHIIHSTSGGSGQGIVHMGVGGMETQDVVSGICIYPASGSIDKGTIIVYGYAEE
jgi:hypothetical protein